MKSRGWVSQSDATEVRAEEMAKNEVAAAIDCALSILRSQYVAAEQARNEVRSRAALVGHLGMAERLLRREIPRDLLKLIIEAKAKYHGGCTNPTFEEAVSLLMDMIEPTPVGGLPTAEKKGKN